MSAESAALLSLLPLTKTEHRILEMLVECDDWVSKWMIAQKCWPDWQFDIEDKTWWHMIDVNVSRIRSKMRTTRVEWEIETHLGWPEYRLRQVPVGQMSAA